MPLPKIDLPLFDTVIPSQNKKVTFRPFLVKEEKILLIAQQSGNDTEIIRAIKQIIQNCVQEDLDIDSLAVFDIEYMFLKLRSKSVNNIVKLSYRDTEDGKVYDFELDLDKIEIQTPDSLESNIKIDDNVGIIMKYPTADITEKMSDFENEVDLMTFFIINCIDSIYDAEGVYPTSDYTEAELTDWLDGLNVNAFESIRKFFESIPKLYHKIEYVNENGNTREIELTNLKDFFMWG